MCCVWWLRPLGRTVLGVPMNWKKEWKALALISSVFLVVFFLPVSEPRFRQALLESLALARWYAREHVLLCLVPAFFIAGAIAVFLNKSAVMKYLGPAANKVLAYGVASVSGCVLAVCSCTVLPLFAGIYRMGAGLGPATAFLYAGPAINVLAIILTARVLGWQLGAARAIGAILFSVVIGLGMHLIFGRERAGQGVGAVVETDDDVERPLWQHVLFFAAMILVLVFANWGRPDATAPGWWRWFHGAQWLLTSVAGLGLGVILVSWFHLKMVHVVSVAVATVVAVVFAGHRPLIPFAVAVIGLSVSLNVRRGQAQEWFAESWGFARQILPLLFIGVLIAGVLLGRPESEGLIPSGWVHSAVGGNSLRANVLASVAGAFMYFATLTEVPILEGLLQNGMGQGPALALLLAGPALSLPNMLVIGGVLGARKTVVFVALVVVMATVSGLIYGYCFAAG